MKNQYTSANRVFRKLTHRFTRPTKSVIAIIALVIIANVALVNYLAGPERRNALKFESLKTSTISDMIDTLSQSNPLSGLLSGNSTADDPYANEFANAPIETAYTPEGYKHEIPDKPFDELELHHKLKTKINDFDEHAPENWLAQNYVKYSDIKVRIGDFLDPVSAPILKTRDDVRLSDEYSEEEEQDIAVKTPEARQTSFKTNSTLWMDPRFTLSVYLNYIKNQYLTKNPKNVYTRKAEEKVTIPFSWTDWVDLSDLNELIARPEDQKMTCEYLVEQTKEKVATEGWCINSKDLTAAQIREMGLSSVDQLPGFAVVRPPDTVGTPESKLVEGKAHLLSFGNLPLNVIFLAEKGIYDVQVSEKARIVDTELFKEYLKNKKISTEDLDTEITLDPVVEFKELTAAVPAMVPKADGAIDFDNVLSQNHYKFVFDKDMFKLDEGVVNKLIEDYESRLNKIEEMTKSGDINDDIFTETSLSTHEFNHYKGLKFSSQFSPDTQEIYYKLARMQLKDDNKDKGWHYEWRFFNGRLDYEKPTWTMSQMEERKKIILHRLLRNWLHFTYQSGIVQWMNHGALLSWYWDGLTFPFDDDLDVQMPALELSNFAKRFNQTLVVEQITDGFGKFFIDCNAFMTVRTHGNGLNNIDARFIDVDSGVYIDITGLSLTNEPRPERYAQLIEQADPDSEVQLYNCRNNHFYHFKELSPARLSMLEGVPVFVPRNFTSILEVEYPRGVKEAEYEDFYYVEPLRLWLHQDRFKEVFEEKDYLGEDGLTDKEKFLELVAKMSDSQVLSLLHNRETMAEFYLTHELTDIHEKEKKLLFHNRSKMTKEETKSYIDLVKTFKKRPALRKPLFQYEKIERFLTEGQTSKEESKPEEPQPESQEQQQTEKAEENNEQ